MSEAVECVTLTGVSTYDPVDRTVYKALQVDGPPIAGQIGPTPTDEDLMIIRKYALSDLEPERIYVRRVNLCNDQWDRHYERLSPEVLERLAETLPGKAVLVGHNRAGEPVGRFYRAEVKVDPGNGWRWLQADWYTPVTPANEHLRAGIDSGVLSYVSIGFRWDRLVCDLCGRDYMDGGACPHVLGRTYPAGEFAGRNVKLTEDGNMAICTATYMGDAEAQEGSLVYLGAQYDAAVVKAHSMKRAVEAAKVASGDVSLPKAPLDTPWAWNAEISNEVLGDPPDWGRYRRAHFWYDPDNAQTKGGYKLPFARMINGRLTMVWRGVAAARARFSQAQIPAEEQDDVLARIRAAYRAFDREWDETGDDAGGDRMNEDNLKEEDVREEESRLSQAWRERDEAINKLAEAQERIAALRTPLREELERLTGLLGREPEWALLQRTFGADLERLPDADLIELVREWSGRVSDELPAERQSTVDEPETKSADEMPQYISPAL